MTTSYLTSADGLAWTRHGTVLEPTPGTWDARGARVTTVLSHDPLVVLYDGRPTAEDNWHETTSVARADATGSCTPTRMRRCCAHRTPTAPCATPAPCPCPTARPGSTSSSPAPTEPTTWSPR